MFEQQKRMLEELIFEILFVMTEVVDGPSTMAFQKTLFLFWIDLGQVLRVMTLPVYGWSQQSYDVVKNIDLVYVLAHFVSKVIPRYSLFILAQFLVLLALGDAAYAAKIFKGNTKVQTMWPIKLLRFLVGSVVTILFSSVLKWLIIPIDCQVSDEKSLSSYFHGEDAPCTPWTFPEAVFSTSSVVSAVAYVSFAIAVSLLCFETNLLARGVRAASTGRVEALWILAKVFVTFMAYLVQYLRAVSCAVVLLVLMLVVLYKHVTVLPFHRHETNLIRGGVFFFVSWLAFSTVIVSAADVGQPTEWTLLALTPVMFVLGVCFTHWMRLQHDRSIERLRAEYQNVQGFSDRASGERRVDSEQDDAQSFSRFYDPTWESRKAFDSPARAKVILRTLLYRRERQDVDFLLYAVERAIQEYPESEELRIFELLIVRFIKQDHVRSPLLELHTDNKNRTRLAFEHRRRVWEQVETQLLEKRYKNDKKLLPIDYRYVLFALERKALKESAGANLGKGKFSVINVMEFDAGMERARKAHMQCITALRKFWSSTKHVRNAERHSGMADEMLHQLSSLNTAIVLAKTEYSSLVELYPTSVTLLHTYAHFCDTILNEPAEAAKWRNKAETLEELSDYGSTGSMHEEEEEDKKEVKKRGEEEHDGGKSSVSGFSASGKTLLERNQQAWRASLLKEEMLAMHSLHAKVKVAVLCMLCTACAGYVVMNHVLLSDMAVANVDSIDSTLKFAGHSIMSMYLLRDQELAARTWDSSRAAHDVERITDYMNQLKESHYQNFEHLRSSEIERFYTGQGAHVDDLLVFNEPFISGWKERQLSFWDGINAWVRRVQRAVRATADELRDPSFVLAQVSDEKRNIAFVFENTIPAVLPAYEELLHLYQDEVRKFVSLADMLVYITAALNAALTLAVSAFVVLRVRLVVPRVQSKRACVYLALRFPRKCQSKLRSFYQDLEHKMEELEEGLQMKEEELGTDAGPEQGGMGSIESEKRGSVGLEGAREPADLVAVRAPEPAQDFEEPLLPHARPSLRLRKGGSGLAALRHTPSARSDLTSTAVGQDQNGQALTAENVTHHIASYDDEGAAVTSPRARMASKPTEFSQRGQRRQDAGRERANSFARLSSSDAFVEKALRGFRLDHARASFRQSRKGKLQSDVRASFRQKVAGPLPGPDPIPAVALRRTDSLRESPRHGLRHTASLTRQGSRGVADDKLTRGTTSDERMSKTQSWLEDNTGLYRTSPVSSPMSGIKPTGSNTSSQVVDKPAASDKEQLRFRFQLSSEVREDPDSPPVAVAGERRSTDEVDADNTPIVRDPVPEIQPEIVEVGVVPEARHSAGAGANAVPIEGEDGDEAEEGSMWKREEVSVRWDLHEATGAKSIIKFDGVAAPIAEEDVPLEDLVGHDQDELSASGPLVIGKSRGDEPGLQLTELNEAVRGELEKKMVQQRQWHSRSGTWLAAMVAVAGLCVFATIFPMRVLPDIQDMAPIVDHGGRRVYMAQEMVMLARELILDDGFSRMRGAEVALRLDLALQRMRIEHEAVRLGGDQGIKVGADLRFDSHNRVMYSPGCEWRQNQGETSSGDHRREMEDPDAGRAECAFGDGTHEDASQNGLHHLIVTFFDTTEAVLDRWGPPGWREMDLEAVSAMEDEFSTVQPNMERLNAVNSDVDFTFLRMAFEGDLLEGLNYVQDLFHEETHHMLQSAHLENELLFILYLLTVTCLWYGVLFRSVSNSADKELNRARDFVTRIPLQVMTAREMTSIGAIFVEPDKNGRDDDAVDRNSSAASDYTGSVVH